MTTITYIPTVNPPPLKLIASAHKIAVERGHLRIEFATTEPATLIALRVRDAWPVDEPFAATVRRLAFLKEFHSRNLPQ